MQRAALATVASTIASVSLSPAPVSASTSSAMRPPYAVAIHSGARSLTSSQLSRLENASSCAARSTRRPAQRFLLPTTSRRSLRAGACSRVRRGSLAATHVPGAATLIHTIYSSATSPASVSMMAATTHASQKRKLPRGSAARSPAAHASSALISACPPVAIQYVLPAVRQQHWTKWSVKPSVERASLVDTFASGDASCLAILPLAVSPYSVLCPAAMS
mmetsp:Transcript_7279/g.12457  ORF Transcript_7279/g.12457 Transcript_7279/m.12457 type:complete len:219 (+) Transcript_7279:647-1303(+)